MNSGSTNDKVAVMVAIEANKNWAQGQLRENGRIEEANCPSAKR